MTTFEAHILLGVSTIFLRIGQGIAWVATGFLFIASRISQFILSNYHA